MYPTLYDWAMKRPQKLPVFSDPLLTVIVDELVNKHKCHTVVLYGSRARGVATAASDYDVLGVRKDGKKYRVAEKRDGFYWDIFVYPERDLKKVTEAHLYMREGKVLFERQTFGTRFLKKLKKVSRRKFKPSPPDEIRVSQIWLHKMLDRASARDVEGNYRRSVLHDLLIYEYFNIRKKRYGGPKAGFAWLKRNDPQTFRLYARVLAHPTNLPLLRRLVERVSGLSHSQL